MSNSPSRYYNRFIPSEEIADVTHWQFGDIDAPAGMVTRAPQPKTTEPPATEPTIELAQHEALLQQIHDEAYARGLAEGQAQAQQQAQQRMDAYIQGEGQALAQRLGQVVQTLEESFAGLQQDMASELLNLATDIARQVVRIEVQSHPKAMLPVVREALSMLVGETRPAKVRLHPTDWQALESALRQEFGAGRVQWQPDPSVDPGGCMVECAGAVIDGSLDKRWRRAIAALGLVSAWQEAEHAD